ncbi:restriction endonuclease subunit S [Aliarcobacter cryaerophilus]|nr:restriction endonuclease subunit S [Aliarcobacter cryaerophilus]
MSEIKQGYKQTKVGIIPEDWEVVKLGKIAPLQRGYDLPTDSVQEGIYPVVYSNGILRFHNEYKAKAPGIVTGRSGTIGRVTYVEDNYWPHNTSLWVTNFYDNNPKFVYYMYINLDLTKFSAGSGVPTLNRNDVHIQDISLPPLKEQEKIAEILTTWDEAITKQTELLRAKELQKKALMQKLLSGEVRFGEFSDEWEDVKIKDIFEITRGYVLAVTEMSQEQTAEYKYPVYSSQTKNNGLTGYYKDYLFENCITWTTDGANAGDVNLRKGKFYCTNVCGVLKSDKGYANQCIAEILNLVTKNYVSYVGNPKLMNNTMGGIKIKIPKSLPEQQKIAEVLSLADDEINLLKNELEELKLQKKALMQKLLTGEVRVKV